MFPFFCSLQHEEVGLILSGTTLDVHVIEGLLQSHHLLLIRCYLILILIDYFVDSLVECVLRVHEFSVLLAPVLELT